MQERAINIFSTGASIALHLVIVLANVDFSEDNTSFHPPEVISIDIDISEYNVCDAELQEVCADEGISEEIIESESMDDQENAASQEVSTPQEPLSTPEDNSISILTQEEASPEIKYITSVGDFDVHKSQRRALIGKISATWSCPPMLRNKDFLLILKVEIQNKRMVFTILNRPKQVTKEWENFARSAIRAAIKSCQEYNSCITENNVYIFKFGYKDK